MKRKAARHPHKKALKARPSRDYVVIVHSWMFLVAFALMLGLGAVVGNFINNELNKTTPQVAGASVER